MCAWVCLIACRDRGIGKPDKAKKAFVLGALMQSIWHSIHPFLGLFVVFDGQSEDGHIFISEYKKMAIYKHIILQ